MFKNLDLIILTILLSIVAFILGVELINMSILQSGLIIVFALFSIPIYKRCRKKQKKITKDTFWNNYWYDMQCKIPTVLYGIISAMLIVFVVNYYAVLKP